jgi:hypothetical protein
MNEEFDEVERMGRYLRTSRQNDPTRVPSREQKINAAIMWILRHEYGLEVPEIEELVDHGWGAPTIRACTNSRTKPDVEAARKHLDEMTAESARRKTTIRINNTRNPIEGDHSDQEPQGAIAGAGFIIRRCSQVNVTFEQVIETIDQIEEYELNGIDPNDVKSFLAACKEAAQKSGGKMDWAEVVQQFLWLWENGRITQVEISSFRITLERLDKKGIRTNNLDELVDTVSKTKNPEVRSIIEEATSLQAIRKARREEERDLIKFRSEAADERSRSDRAIGIKREKLEMMQKEIDKKAPLLKEIQRWKKGGFEDVEEIGVIRETAEKHYHKDLSQLMAEVRAQGSLENIKIETKEQENKLRILRGEVLGTEELHRILVPRIRKGDTGDEIRQFIEDAFLFADRSGSLQDARNDFRSMSKIKSLRDEVGRLAGVVNILKNEQVKSKAIIDSGLKQIGDSVAEATHRIGEAAIELEGLKVTSPAKIESNMPTATHQRPNKEDVVEVTPTKFGTTQVMPPVQESLAPKEINSLDSSHHFTKEQIMNLIKRGIIPPEVMQRAKDNLIALKSLQRKENAKGDFG